MTKQRAWPEKPTGTTCRKGAVLPEYGVELNSATGQNAELKPNSTSQSARATRAGSFESAQRAGLNEKMGEKAAHKNGSYQIHGQSAEPYPAARSDSGDQSFSVTTKRSFQKVVSERGVNAKRRNRLPSATTQCCSREPNGN